MDNPNDYHRMYFGEILAVSGTEQFATRTQA